jgi:ribosomal protein S18 acetylase RimI-like enzyme
MDLVCVTVDCGDPSAVAAFWTAALRWNAPEVAHDGSCAICRAPRGGLYLEFVQVPEGKVTKNRLHFGCNVRDLDHVDDEITRLLALGATVAWEEEFAPEVAANYRNVILRDVEGNEFCLGGGHLVSRASPPRIDVRRAEPQDRSRLVDLSRRLADTAPPWRRRGAVESAIAESISAIVDRQDKDDAIMVAEIAGQVVGFITLGRRNHFTGDIDAAIDDLVVDTDSEGRGVAAALLAHAESWAQAHSLQRLTVETSASNQRALRRYRANGFTDEDIRLTKPLDA